MRAGQRRFFRLVDEYRLIAFLARRQYGKTTTFAHIALKKMMKTRDHTVIFGSAKLNLSREIVRKEADILQSAIREAIAQTNAGALHMADALTGKLTDKLSIDDFAEQFEAQRMEFRYYHDRGSYSRTKVVALRPDTVGETGDLMCDELRAIGNWREVWEAVKPIISSNPQFRCTLSTTIPTSDNHYAYEQLIPPPGVVFTPHPDGNLYESDNGIMVLRVDADDAYADGVPLYDDKTGQPLTPAESRARDRDKDAWDRNYGCKFLVGGTSACGLLQLDSAQQRGAGACLFRIIETDDDFDQAMQLLPTLLSDGPVGVGYDIATTTKAISNPSSLSIVERTGIDYRVPMILVWKTGDERIAELRVKTALETIPKRTGGRRPLRLCIDATNEKYFASRLRRKLSVYCPVELVVGSETADVAGNESMNMKQWTGSRLIGALDDNHLTLPGDRYVREDWRLVKKDRGLLVCDPDSDGKHGDTFDSTKLGLHAVLRGGPAEASAASTGQYGMHTPHGSDPMASRPDHSSDSAPRSGVVAV
jgi:hypothetical protein